MNCTGCGKLVTAFESSVTYYNPMTIICIDCLPGRKPDGQEAETKGQGHVSNKTGSNTIETTKEEGKI